MQALKRVKEISNIARGSKHWCRAKSSFAAASAPCDEPVVKRTGKRLPISDRRAMVKSFVDRYQCENSGKFPTVSHARKEVGGSFYVVKKIMQELEYNSKLSSSNAGKEVSPNTEVRSSYLSCGPKSEADEYKPSPVTSILMNTEDVKEEEQYKLPLNIDGTKSKSEFLQPLSEVSCSENSKDDAEKLARGSVLDVEYLSPKNAENIRDEEPKYFQQTLPEISSAKKSEDAKEETTCESVLGVDNLESKNEEYQPFHEYSVPKILENTKEVKPNQVEVDMDGSDSIAEEHRKSTGESIEKQTLEKFQIKSSLWGTLKSAAEDFFSIWRKR